MSRGTHKQHMWFMGKKQYDMFDVIYDIARIHALATQLFDPWHTHIHRYSHLHKTQHNKQYQSQLIAFRTSVASIIQDRFNTFCVTQSSTAIALAVKKWFILFHDERFHLLTISVIRNGNYLISFHSLRVSTLDDDTAMDPLISTCMLLQTRQFILY